MSQFPLPQQFTKAACCAVTCYSKLMLQHRNQQLIPFYEYSCTGVNSYGKINSLALSRWKFMGCIHNKDFTIGCSEEHRRNVQSLLCGNAKMEMAVTAEAEWKACSQGRYVEATYQLHSWWQMKFNERLTHIMHWQFHWHWSLPPHWPSGIEHSLDIRVFKYSQVFKNRNWVGKNLTQIE